MPDIYRYFRADYGGHSSTNAFLLALPSYFVYPASITWRGSMWHQFKDLFDGLSDGDSFRIEAFARERDGIDIQAVAMVNTRLILVVFRGSEKKRADWETNAQHRWKSMSPTWGYEIRVHRGFYYALREIYKDLRSFIRSYDDTRKVFLAGHSLGGALAILCGYRLQKVGGVDVQGVYSWGSPRVGNINWKTNHDALLGSRCFRWVKGADFAAGLPDAAPPGGPGNSYFHVGQLNYINADGSVEMDKTDFEAIGASVPDHDMGNYVFKMMDRLSNKKRTTSNSPSYLVEKDVNTLFLPSRDTTLHSLIIAGAQ